MRWLTHRYRPMFAMRFSAELRVAKSKNRAQKPSKRGFQKPLTTIEHQLPEAVRCG